VTHTDEEYMAKHNEVDGRAIYFISANEQQPEILEMGFELTAYQPTLQAHREQGKPRIYQTIYLDQQRSSLWTIGELKPESIIDRAWWSAFSHTYKHFRRVVPWVWTMQGHKHTWFAGSWTLFNTHDIAISSGLAVAHRLGAPYPFVHNELATATFDTVYAANHLRMRSWSVFCAALKGMLCCASPASSQAKPSPAKPSPAKPSQVQPSQAKAKPPGGSETDEGSDRKAMISKGGDHISRGGDRTSPAHSELPAIDPTPPADSLIMAASQPPSSLQPSSLPPSPPSSHHGRSPHMVRGLAMPLRSTSAIFPAAHTDLEAAQEAARCEA